MNEKYVLEIKDLKSYGCFSFFILRPHRMHRLRSHSHGMPVTVTVNSHHNHLLLNAEALSFRKIDPVTHSKFEDYFEQGMTAAGVTEFHSNCLDLDDCDGGSLAVVRADAAVDPVNAVHKHVFEFGLYGSRQKPSDVKEFLHPLVLGLQQLEHDGVVLGDVNYCISILMAVWDVSGMSVICYQAHQTTLSTVKQGSQW